MTTDTENPSDPPVTVGIDAIELDEYSAFTTLDGGELVLYSRSNDRAWIQTDAFVNLEGRR